MYNQYDARWKNQPLGTSNVTIGGYGCNLTSIAYGLKQHGWDYTPLTLNVIFTKNGSYSNGNLIDPAQVAKTNPGLFKAGWREEWNDDKVKNYIKNYNDYIIVGEVDARGIGGTGQHFVLLLDLVLNNGKISNTLIGDPWGGIENLATIRYAKYGCIKSLRVYQVKAKSNGNQQSGGSTDNGSDLEGDTMYNQFLDVDNFEAGKNKLIEHLGIKGDKCAWGDASGDGGGYLGSERRKVKRLEEENADLSQQTEKDRQEIGKQLKQITDLQAQVSTLDQTLIDKNKLIDELYAKLDNSGNEELKARIDQLLSEVALKDQTIEKLQAEVEYYKNQSSSCETKPLWEQIVERLKELFA